MKRTLLVFAALLISSPAGAETINFWPKDHMEQQIVSKSGINTSKARIVAITTPKIARAYCREHERSKPLATCIHETMKVPFPTLDPTHTVHGRTVLTGNCETGEFNGWGLEGPFRFVKNPEETADTTMTYYLEDDNGVIHDAVSGWRQFVVFRALCPASIPSDFPL